MRRVNSSKKLWSLWRISLAVMLILSACVAAPVATSPETQEETAGAESAAEQPEAPLSGTIELLNWNASPAIDQAIEQAARAFEETHPGTTVNITLLPYDQVQQKLALLVASGTPPETFGMTNDIMRFVQEGKVLPLDEYIENDLLLNDPERTRVDAYDLYRFEGGNVYGQGAQGGVMCSMQLYFNQDLFDQAGLDYPNETWTWDDFLEAAQQLTIKENGETVQWGTDLGYLTGWDGGWQALAASMGANIIDTNFNPEEVRLADPAVVEAWQFMQDLVYQHGVAPNPATAEALSQAGGPFLSGKVAMVPDGCWMLSSYKNADFALGMTLLPQGEAGRVHPVWLEGYAVAAESPNPDLAWEWLRWLVADPKANEILAGAGTSCGAPLVREFDELYSVAWQGVPGGEACVTSLDTAEYFRIFHPDWARIYDTVIAPEWDKFMQGRISAQELSDLIADPVNVELK